MPDKMLLKQHGLNHNHFWNSEFIWAWSKKQKECLFKYVMDCLKTYGIRQVICIGQLSLLRKNVFCFTYLCYFVCFE